MNIQNSLVACNRADKGGGFYFDSFVKANLVNCTIVHNEAHDDPDAGTLAAGGGVAMAGSCASVRNSILWNNEAVGANRGPNVAALPCSKFDIAYSAIEYGCTPYVDAGDGIFVGSDATVTCLEQANVFTDDPHFRNPVGPDAAACTGDEDFRLLNATWTSSVAIDSGDDKAVLKDAADLNTDSNTIERTPLDLDLSLRLVDEPSHLDTGVPDSAGVPVVDMGAYEYCSVVGIEPAGHSKSRYISFVVNPNYAGQQFAIAVVLESLHHPPAPAPADSPDFSASEKQTGSGHF